MDIFRLNSIYLKHPSKLGICIFLIMGCVTNGCVFGRNVQISDTPVGRQVVEVDEREVGTSDSIGRNTNINEHYVDPLDIPSPAESLLSPSKAFMPHGFKGPNESEDLAPAFEGLEGWINSDPITLADLRGKVVLIDFWTYTCINCIRTFPYLKEWHDKYNNLGLAIVGIHAPEFEFEKSYENVMMAVSKYKLGYPVVQDNDRATWKLFNNRVWPAKYLIDKDGYIRYEHFGEGNYYETEFVIRQLLREKGSDPNNIEHRNESELEIDERAYSGRDLFSRQTRELYAGFMRNYGALSSGSQPYVAHEDFYQGPNIDNYYQDPGNHKNNFIYLQGLWSNELEGLKHARKTINYEDFVAVKVSAIEANVVLSLDQHEPYSVRITIDGRPLRKSEAGSDVRFDVYGNSYIYVDSSDMYRLIKLPAYGSHELQISSNSDNFKVFAFTFGSYLD